MDLKYRRFQMYCYDSKWPPFEQYISFKLPKYTYNFLRYAKKSPYD